MFAQMSKHSLDHWNVDDRQHLLWSRQRQRSKTGAFATDQNDGLHSCYFFFVGAVVAVVGAVVAVVGAVVAVVGAVVAVVGAVVAVVGAVVAVVGAVVAVGLDVAPWDACRSAVTIVPFGLGSFVPGGTNPIVIN
ncbi:MAG: hypothetical protein ACYDHU_02795 [Acidimicrobiales bacterium]